MEVCYVSGETRPYKVDHWVDPIHVDLYRVVSPPDYVMNW